MAPRKRRQRSGIRSVLVDGLKPLLPRDWKLMPYRTTTDDINQVTVWVKLRSLEKLAEAPASGYMVASFVVTVATPKAALAEADADLDDRVVELVHALDALQMVRRSSAEQVAVSDTHLGFDITVEVFTRPETE